MTGAYNVYLNRRLEVGCHLIQTVLKPAQTPEEDSGPARQRRVPTAKPSISEHPTGLADAGNEAAFCSAWLSLQCARIPGLIAAALLVPAPAKGLSVTCTFWPPNNPYTDDLVRLAERAALERRALTSVGDKIPNSAGELVVGLFIASPLGRGMSPSPPLLSR